MTAQGPTEKEILLDALEQTLGKDAVKTIEPVELEEPEEEEEEQDIVIPENAPICVTQQIVPPALRNGPADIVVGLMSECPRWVPGSVIKFAAWRQGYESDDDANYAATHLARAADAWNKADIGVTFEWVPLAKDATFVLFHGGDADRTLASAFFPNNDDLSYMLVYNFAFTEKWKPHMWKVFMHELGHVLGLRHEFAISGIPERGIRAEKMGAVRLGKRDDKSVMNYSPDPPELQQSDIDSTKLFYSLRNDADGNPPKVRSTPVKDYVPH